MGIAALISTLLGFLGGIVPDIMKEIRDSRAATREREFLLLQNQLQLERMKAEAGAKLREAEGNLVAEEIRATREHLTAIIEAQAKPSGVGWIDALNAVLRPMAASFILVLFLVTAGGFVYAVLEQYRSGDIQNAKEVAEVIWGSLVGFSIEAVFGFLFGARQVRKGMLGSS